MCGCLRGFQKRRTRATYGHDAGQKTIHKKGWIGMEKNDDTTGEETHEKLKERTTRREKKESF